MTIKNECSMEKFTITPETIRKFEVMENRRQIGESQVGKIHGVILSKKNPLGVLIVNQIGNVWRLIDGNHRIEAVKRFYTKESNKSINIEAFVKVYKGLTPDQEREVYSNEAKRKNESHEDRLALYKDTIVFWKLTQDSINRFPCPVTIYPSKNGLRFRTILDSLATVKTEQKNGYVPRYLAKDSLVEFAQELKYDDLIIIVKFIKVFERVFGKVGTENIFTRRQSFLPLVDIFYKNFLNTKEDEVVKKFNVLVGKSDILMYLFMQGREAQQKIRELMLGYLNKGIKMDRHRIV